MDVRRLAPLLGLAALQCHSPSAAGSGGDVAGSEGRPEVSRRFVDLSSSTAGFEHTRREGARPVSRIAEGDTIFFRNTDSARFCVVRVEGNLLSSRECATVTGFTLEARAAVSHPIAPGGFASVCFHEAGRYPIEVSGGAGPLLGALEVVPR